MSRSIVATAPGPDIGRVGSRRPGPRRAVTFVGLAAPAMLLMIVINAYPVCIAAVQAVHDGDLLDTGRFIGADNFVTALTDPQFWAAARFTLVFTLAGVFGSWIVGFGFSLLLQPRFPGRGFFKVVLLLPWIVPIVVSSMSWNWLVATRESLFPQIAHALGFGNVLFLADPTLAAVTVCVFKAWISYPFMMMMMSAALEGIDQSVYEAARVDGTSAWQRLRYVVLPMTARPTFISWILMTMFSVNDFPTIYLLTGGGPVNATSSLVVLAYRSVFQNFQVGYGVAIAFIMTAALIAISVALFRQIRKVDFQ